MPGREYTSQSAAGYRFGFNGKEKDDEISGDGNAIDFGARIYEGRIGRWLSLDPLQQKFPDYSPYCYALGSPISLVDFDGRDIKPTASFSGSDYEQQFNRYKSQNNQGFMTIFNYFDNNGGTKDLILGFENKDQIGKKVETSVGGLAFSKDHKTSQINWNPNFKPSEIGDWHKDIDRSQLLGKAILSRSVLNDKGKGLFFFHEMIHAYIIQEEPDISDNVKRQHNKMGSDGGEYFNLMKSFLTEANIKNGWGLDKNQIKDISYFGLDGTPSFTKFIAKQAGIPENWETVTDVALKEEYSNKSKNAAIEWKSRVNNIIYDKEYKDE